MLAKAIEDDQRNWSHFVPYVVAAYNATVHSATSFSPNYLMFGRELNSAVDLAFCVPGEDEVPVNDYAFSVAERMAKAYELVRAHSGRVAQNMKRIYDASAHPISCQVGDLVWYFCPRTRVGTSPKWTRFYSGPFTVRRKINDVNYVIQRSAHSRPIVAHINKLKPYRAFTLAI
jgi:hypothetical protein